MPARTLRVHVDAERQSLLYHAERGNDQGVRGVWHWDCVQIHFLGWRRFTFPPLRRVTFEKAPKVTKSARLLVGPSFLGYPHSDDAPWARAERASMP